MRWPEVCLHLQKATGAVIEAADWEALGSQLIFGRQQGDGHESEPELVTSKVTRLCQRLMASKVCRTPSVQPQHGSHKVLVRD